jgi:ABC-2 type transport system permease protein
VARVDMGKLGVVLKREYLERVRSKWFVIGTLLGPVFFGAITVLPVIMSSRTKQSSDMANVAILDATGGAMGTRIASALAVSFPTSPAPVVERVAPADLPRAVDRATLEVQHKVRRGYLVLDSATLAGTRAVYAGRNAGSMGDVEELRSLVRQQVLAHRLATVGLDSAHVADLVTTRLDLVTEKIGDQGREKGSGLGAFAVGYLLAFLMYMMIILYGQMILRGVMEEKTTRVAEVVVSSVTTDTLLAGKILGVGAVALTQVFAWLGLSAAMGIYVLPLLLRNVVASPAAGSAGAPTTAAVMAALPSMSLFAALAMLGFFLIGFLFYSALFAAVGAMVSSQEDAQQASMPVMLLLVSSIIFMGPIATNPSSTVARTMSLLPFSAPILMPLRMTLVAVPWYEVLGALAGVAVAAVLATWLSARIYRVGLLMYGKKPSFAELARWVRYAGG